MPGQRDDMNYGDAVEPIAIVGMACRFPGQVSSPQEFWDMLASERSGHCKVPSNRFDADVWHHPDHERKGAIQPKSGFFLDGDVSLFDAPFFSITAKEAMGMDPMQRQLLEVAYECFENAGVPLENLSGSMTSVYTGVMTNDYELVSAADIYNLPQNAASGTSRAMLSNRLSWFFNLQGPSLTLDTACSSSLYALHLACQSVRLGESQQALVTGVNLILHANFISQLSSMHMLSPDGISHSFDDRANGYGRGEAVGAVLVKPLSRALADGDTIRAVIRGSGANQDGKTPGITMPSGEAQANLIRSTYATAGLPMADTSYFEAHGTGTKIGDPIELAAIGSSFGQFRASDNPLYVGSAKTNVGHTEGMAGLAGVIKTVLSLENAVLPGLVGFETLNPKLLLDNWKLALPVNTMKWPTKGLRRASVNSFGFGGANAHLILDDAYHYLKSHQLEGRHFTVADDIPEGNGISSITQGAAGSEATHLPDYKLLVFSMQDQNGLERLSTSMTKYLSLDSAKGQRPTINMDELAYTLASRRSQFSFRSFAVGRSIEDLTAGGLKTMARTKQKRLGRANNVIFVFTGQGAQWPLMGRELLKDPIFNASVKRSQQYLGELGCLWSAADLLQDPGNRINIAEYCQPICTVLQVALVDMLAHWGVTPQATVGHSSGEIAAAYAAGGITQKDAIKIAYMRGYYCGQIQIRLKDKRGAMMAAGLTPQEAERYLEQVAEGSVVIGCVNSPSSVTLSGDIGAISYLEELIKMDGKFARKLRVEVAYHSPHMHTVSEDFLASMGTIETANSFKVPMFSSVTTEQLDTPVKLDAAYWVTNMVSPVRFSEAVNSLLAYSTSSTKSKRKTRVTWSAALEIGPHEALKGPFSQSAAVLDGKKSNILIPYTSMVRRGERADKSAREAAGLLWSLGHSLDVVKVNNASENSGHELKVLTSLPPYPWQHSKGFWHEPATSASARLSARPRTDLLGVPVDNQNSHEPRWKNFLRLSENPWMRDHAITGTVLYPAAGMIIMALEAALQMAADEGKAVRGVEFHDIHFDRGLVIPDVDDAVETSLSLRPHETLDSWFHWTVFSVPPGGSWTKHCFGLLALVYDEGEGHQGTTNNLSYPSQSERVQWEAERKKFGVIKERATKPIEPSGFYSQLETIGMGYGPTFTNLTVAAAVEDEKTGYGTVVIPDTRATMPSQREFPHVIHPATLDAIFHLIFVALFEGKPMNEAAIPVTVEKLFVAASQPIGPGAEFIGFSTATKINDRDSSGSIVVSDQTWSSAKVLVTNMVVRKVSSPSAAPTSGVLSSSTNKVPKRIAQLRWKEDIDMLDRAAAESLIRREAVHHQSRGLSSVTAQAAVWLERAWHKNATLKVLAIADSSRSSEMIVEILSLFGPIPGQTLRFDTCTVASATEDLLSPLRNNEKLQGLSVQYELLDLGGASPEQQVQELGSFNIILADIGRVSQDDEKTLAHIAALAAPDCKLVALGIANSQSIAEEVEDKRVGRQPFDKILAHIDSDSGELLIATTVLESPSIELPVVIVLERPSMSAELAVLKQNLGELFRKSGTALESRLLGEAKSFAGQTVICLLEAEEALVMNWTADEFEQFRDLVFSQSYILWVTRGGFLDSHDASLQFAPTTGLLRTMRVEVPQIVLPHVDLSPSANLTSSATAQMVFDAFHTTSKPKVSGGKENEMELVESGGSFFIPRAIGDDAFDEELNAHSDEPGALPGLLSDQDGRPLMLAGSGPSGSLGESHWTEDPDAARPLDDDEVEVKTTHVALNSADLDTVASTTWQTSVGRAASGIITRAGVNVHNFKVGNKVFFPFLEGGALKTRLRQHQTLISKLQEGLRLEDAASLPTAFLTASYCLTDVARVLPEERVLIHLIASGESQAAIQIAQALGTEVFVTVASITERSLLAGRYKIAEDHIFNSTSRDLAQTLTTATGGKGFDVVISDHAGASRRQASLCVAELGRFVDTSRKVHASDMSMALFERNVSFSTVDIQRLGQAKLKDLFQKTADMLREGSITATASTAPLFPVSSLESVWDFLAASPGASAVVSFDDNATVPILPAKPPPLALDPHATYMIAGGLGALGLTIAENMAEHGARHLVLLSRSGVTNSRQREAVERLRQRKCAVDTVNCDVTDTVQVASVIALSKEKGWSIKGLIQCAMVLRDSIFENMTFDKWLGATQPKIKGTWNLHHHLPPSLDFFVVLSSMSGIIGNAAQANYCAGNAYEDALAHYRHARGLKATTLNVGLVTDASHFTADATIDDYLKRYGHWASAIVSDREMQITLEAVMRGHTASGDAVPVQLLVGITDDVPRDDGLNPWSKDRKFDHRVRKLEADASGGAGGSRSVAEELKASESGRDAIAVVESALRTHVAAAMTAAPEEIDAEKPLYSFGIDSLKAIQVRNWVFQELKCDVSVFDILSPMPLAQLAASIARKSSLVSPELVAMIEQEGL
ncbi:hypothetical protein MMC30_008275 [Trapelia coarctata]|nr:hypothetical protein [Trapelia coarctata]